MNEVQVWLCVGWCLACLFFGLFLAQFCQNHYMWQSHRKATEDKSYWEREYHHQRSRCESLENSGKSKSEELDALRKKLRATERQEPRDQE